MHYLTFFAVFIEFDLKDSAVQDIEFIQVIVHHFIILVSGVR